MALGIQSICRVGAKRGVRRGTYTGWLSPVSCWRWGAGRPGPTSAGAAGSIRSASARALPGQVSALVLRLLHRRVERSRQAGIATHDILPCKLEPLAVA